MQPAFGRVRILPWRSHWGPTASEHDPGPAFISGSSSCAGTLQKVLLPLFSCSQKVMEGGHFGDLYMLFYPFSTGVSISSSVKWIVPASPSVVMIRVANAYKACSVLPSTGLPFVKCVLCCHCCYYLCSLS